jgi:signal transduction histidine kinase
VRLEFDRTALPRGDLALYLTGVRDQARIWLNGREIGRTVANADDRRVTWAYPLLFPLPAADLAPGRNVVLLEIRGSPFIGLSEAAIGDQATLTREADRFDLLSVDLPHKANFTMMSLAYGGLLIWLFGRRDPAFLALFVGSFGWFTAGMPHLFQASLFGRDLIIIAPPFITAIATWVTGVFVATFLGERLRRRVLLPGLALAIGPGVAWLAGGDYQICADLAEAAAVVLLAFAAGLAFQRPRIARDVGPLRAALVFGLCALVHDGGRLWWISAWRGLGFDLVPYVGAALNLAVLWAFGRQAMEAFDRLRGVNLELETGIAQARAELAASEARLRAVEVQSAVETERARMLREVHDGVGSSLVTALRIAEANRPDAAEVRPLRQALADLKITIDSLEPVGGNLPALLGNLRRRLTGDLNAAGVAMRWRVEDCRPLPWLDPPGALNVLRIFQEAIANALSHGAANTLELGCADVELDGRPGVRAYLADDGQGFAMTESAGGKGLANMRTRTAALGGELTISSEPGQGVRIALWLPLEKS